MHAAEKQPFVRVSRVRGQILHGTEQSPGRVAMVCRHEADVSC